MSTPLELKEFQIALLELQALKLDADSIHIPGYVRRGGWIDPYLERERTRRKRKKKWLSRRIDYLKRQHYIESVKAGEERLYRLTAKGKYEILRLQFALHMQAERRKKWDGNFYLIVWDIPEMMKKYRDFFRKLLKRNGFTMLQQSVWMTRVNPRPAIKPLLEYLSLEKYFEIIKISCKECSPRVRRKVRM